MRIDSEVKLDFKDVLIRPKRSTLMSRADVMIKKYYNMIKRCLLREHIHLNIQKIHGLEYQ